MKKWLVITGTIVVLLSGIYAFAWFFVLPKSALAMMPYKWRSVRLGQKRTDYLFYLGDPVSDTLKWRSSGDTWIVRSGNYTYELRLQYSSDALSSGRMIKYHFENWLFDKEDVIIDDAVDETKSDMKL